MSNKKLGCYLQGQGHSEEHVPIKKVLYLLNLQFFVTKLSLVVDHQKRKVLCSENIGWLCSVSRSQEGFKFQLRYVLLYVWTISSELLTCDQGKRFSA